MMRGGMGARPQHSQTHTVRRDPSAFEVSASLYSPKLGRSVALVGMRYTGPSEDEALKMFVEKFGAFLPNASCVGFSDDVAIDEKKIRDLISANDPPPSAAPSGVSAPASAPAQPSSASPASSGAPL
jgi:hypothetical protein